MFRGSSHALGPELIFRPGAALTAM